jgi:hypothetical protein
MQLTKHAPRHLDTSFQPEKPCPALRIAEQSAKQYERVYRTDLKSQTPAPWYEGGLESELILLLCGKGDSEFGEWVYFVRHGQKWMNAM